MDNTFNVGDIGAVKTGTSDHVILAKITEIEGGVFQITTPHGSNIKLGLLYMATFTPLTEEQQRQYDAWVIDSARQKEEIAKAKSLK